MRSGSVGGTYSNSTCGLTKSAGICAIVGEEYVIGKAMADATATAPNKLFIGDILEFWPIARMGTALDLSILAGNREDCLTAYTLSSTAPCLPYLVCHLA